MSNYNFNDYSRLNIELKLSTGQLAQAVFIHTADLQEQLQNAIDEYCKPENLTAIINKTCKQYIDEAIEKEISAFFRYGQGAEVIKMVVNKKLDDQMEFYKNDN